MKYSLTFLLCLFTLISHSQTVELNKLKSFIYKPVAQVTDSLQKKGWLVRPELSGKKVNQLYTTFSFGHFKNDKKRARAWFRIHADNGIVNQLYYQTPGVKQFNRVVEEIKKTAKEKENVDNIEDNKLSFYYVSDGFIFETTAGTHTIMVATDRGF